MLVFAQFKTPMALRLFSRTDRVEQSFLSALGECRGDHGKKRGNDARPANRPLFPGERTDFPRLDVYSFVIAKHKIYRFEGLPTGPNPYKHALVSQIGGVM
jgi:hypothetical protein